MHYIRCGKKLTEREVDRRMTDNEIIKALECCNNKESDCRLCILWTTNQCTKVLGEATIALINRQKAEIERLKYNLEAVLNERADHSEAIKEFAERVKEEEFASGVFGASYCREKIDNLVKKW